MSTYYKGFGGSTIKVSKKGKVSFPKPKVSKPVKTFVKKAIRRDKEVRALDTVFSSATCPYDASEYTGRMTAITQGDDAHQRDGNKVRIKRIELNLIATMNSFPSFYRILVYQWKKDSDKQDPGIQIGGASTNTIVTGSGGSGSEYMAPYFIEYQPYFKMLYDKTFQFSSTSETSHRIHKIRINGKRLSQLVFDEDASTEGKNQVYLSVISNRTNTSTYAPTIYALARCLFYA